MARTGINYIDVANAAKQVQVNGSEPTVDRVRSELGTGSKSTIAPLLKRWKEGEGNIQAVEGIPKALADAVQALYHQTVTAAQDSFEEERVSLTAQLEEARTQLRTSKNDLSSLKNDSAELASERDKLSSSLEYEQSEKGSLKVEIATLTAKLEAREEKLTENKLVITELKAENKALREHFEHFQSHSSEERQVERDQYTQTLNIERQRHMTLADELGSARKKLSTIECLTQDRQATILALELKVKTLSDDLTRAKNERKEIQLNQSGMAKQLESLIKDHRDLSEKLKVTEKENSMLIERNVTLLEQSESANAKLELLNDQLHHVAQEKAVIQGKFVQLQSSL